MSYFTLKDGQRLYYEDKGHGSDTLIMMHGWTSTHDVYEKPMELLQDKARCIIYDHRGHGGSKEANKGTPTTDNCGLIISSLPQIKSYLGADNLYFHCCLRAHD